MRKQDITCPVCGRGTLSTIISDEEININGHMKTIHGFRSSICDSCGVEVTGNEDSRHNKRLVLEGRKKEEGLLLGSEIKAIRKKFGITQQTASLVFGGGTVAFSKYENGDLVQSTAMDRLLRVAQAIPEVYYWLAAFVGRKDESTLNKKNIINTTFDTTSIKPGHKMFCVDYRNVPQWHETFNNAANMSENCHAAESA